MDVEAKRADGQVEKLRADYLLVATGRGPVTDGLGAADAGLALERGYIRVDAGYRTSVPGISAIGDVITMGETPHPQLAHVSSAEGILVAERDGRPRGAARSTTTTCRRAPTASPKSAAWA